MWIHFISFRFLLLLSARHPKECSLLFRNSLVESTQKHIATLFRRFSHTWVMPFIDYLVTASCTALPNTFMPSIHARFTDFVSANPVECCSECL